jgi:hypothetical protein
MSNWPTTSGSIAASASSATVACVDAIVCAFDAVGKISGFSTLNSPTIVAKTTIRAYFWPAAAPSRRSQLVQQAQVLVDEREAGAGHDLARVARHHAREDLDQRRLAGAVLTQQRVDLAAPQGEVDVRERLLAAERLAQPADLQGGAHRPQSSLYAAV